MNSVCEFCMQRVYLQSLSSVPLLPMTSKKEKKCQFGYSEILLLQGKLHLRVWACFLLLLSSVSFLISPCIPSLLSLFVVTFFLYTSTCSDISSAVLFPLRFPVPGFCLSGGGFRIREAFWCRAASIPHVNKKDGWKHSGRTFVPASLPRLVFYRW